MHGDLTHIPAPNRRGEAIVLIEAPASFYDTAMHALAQARSVAEVKDTLNIADAIREFARRAKNTQLEADAVELRLQAARLLGKRCKEQEDTVGLANGGQHGGRRRRIDGIRATPSIAMPTYASQGIDKNLAKMMRRLREQSDEDFAQTVKDARAKVTGVMQTVVDGLAPPSGGRRRVPALTVPNHIATIIRACVQIAEVDAVLAFLRGLRDPSEVMVPLAEFAQAAAVVQEELATRWQPGEAA
jgi:hypothetical protein